MADHKESLLPSVISSEVFQDLVHYFKYASSAYMLLCPRPNGKHLVTHFSNLVTDIQGFVARDRTRKEIIIGIRGSVSIVDFLMDTQILLIPFISPGVKAPSGTRVHSGFLTAWNSIALQVIAIVSVELAAHPDHSLVTTGHSLGGSLAALAAIALQQKFPQSEVRAYSYGAPRTGNRAFADFMKDQLGPAAYRVVHTNDGVPTMIPVLLGYHHHGVEYWQREDPATELNTIKLSDDGEDPNGSASIPSHGINRAHVTYLGVAASTPFCF